MVKIAFPISSATASNRDGKMFGHFGKARIFYVVNDLDDPSKDEIIENNSDHFGGVLSPPDYCAEMKVTAFVTIGMGMKAIQKFENLDIPVYQGGDQTIGQLVEMYKKGELSEMTEGCSHHDDHHH